MTKTALLRTVMMGTVALCAARLPAQIFTSMGPPVAIPDPPAFPGTAMVSSTINVGSSLIINDLNVNLDYEHTFQEDLIATITSPTGTMVQLFTQVGGSADAQTGGYLFDDEATDVFPNMGDPIPTGSYLPSQSVSAFDGEDAAGDWTLTVSDTFTNDTGTLNFWQLIFNNFVANSGDTAGSNSLASLSIGELQANSEYLNVLARRLRSGGGGADGMYVRATPYRFGRTSAGGVRLVSTDEATGNVTVEEIFNDPSTVVRGQGGGSSVRTWVAGYGAGGFVDGGYDYNYAGTAFGAENVVDAETVLGLSGNYFISNGNSTVTGIDLDSIGVALYGNRLIGASAYLTGIAGYNHGDYGTFRQTMTGNAHGNTRSDSLLVLLEVGENVDLDNWTLQPHAGFQYINISVNGYNENGAGTSNLQVGSNNTDSARGIFGADLARPIYLSRGGVLAPVFRGAYIHEFADGDQVINACFAGGGGPMVIQGARLGHDFVELGAGLNLATRFGISLFADYEAQYSTKHDQHTGRGGVSYAW